MGFLEPEGTCRVYSRYRRIPGLMVPETEGVAPRRHPCFKRLGWQLGCLTVFVY